MRSAGLNGPVNRATGSLQFNAGAGKQLDVAPYKGSAYALAHRALGMSAPAVAPKGPSAQI